ncbi:MAG: phage portal protein [Actinobacteria bacterium]|nr:phage portal protein [Actinomycetota bacterium]
MSLLFSKRGLGDSENQLVPPRNLPNGRRLPTSEESMRHSAVWSCLNLRSSLISTLPAVQYRMSAGLKVPMPSAQLLTAPGSLHVGGPLARFDEWISATQTDLDRYGNAFGYKVAIDGGWGVPTRIDLLPAENVTVRVRDGVVTYAYGGKTYNQWEIWHERQFVVPGSPVGMSPMSAAAYSVSQYTTAQAFAAQWFSSGGIPSAKLQTGKTITPAEALQVKNRIKAMLSAGDVLVLGKDQDYEMITVPANQAAFIEAMDFSVLDVARIYNTPGDMIDIPIKGSRITYANVTQKNLDYLTIRLAPSIFRRERAISAALPMPHLMEFQSDALLRLDPQTLTMIRGQQVDKRALTPDEWREMDNRKPLTADQISQFSVLFSGLTTSPGVSDVAA